MDKKQSRNSTRNKRPPNLNLKLCGTSAEIQENHLDRENDDFGVFQQSMPIFASVHRPRQASISAIKRDAHLSHNQSQNGYSSSQSATAQQQQQQRSVFRPIQTNGPSNDLIFTIDRITGDNGNSSIRGRMLDVTSAKQSWQGISNHHHHQPTLSIPVAIPQPFVHVQKQQLSHLPVCEQFSSFSGGLQVPNSTHLLQCNRQENQQTIHLQQQHQQATSHLESIHGRTVVGQQQQQHQPISQQNFNQISKTATNLLHDIYEKHLLNQTTFENVNMLNRRVIMKSGQSGPMCMPSSVGSNVVINGSDAINGTTIIDGNTFNFNNPQSHHNKQQSIRGRRHQQPNPPYINPPNFIANHCINNSSPAAAPINQPHQDPTVHLYESVDETVVTHDTTNSSNPTNNAISATSSNRTTTKKRTPGKVQRNSKNSISDNKQNNSSNQRKHMSGGNDENYFGATSNISHHQESTPSHHNNHYPPLFSQPYNYQPRTKGDGENQPNDNNKIGMSENVPVAVGGKLSSSSNLQQSSALDRTSNNFTNATGATITTTATTVPVKDCSGISNSSMQNIRSAPIGGTGTSKIHEEDNKSSTNFIPEINAIAGSGCIVESSFPSELNNGQGTILDGGCVAKVQYRNSKIDLMLETAQAVAAAAYYARAAQKLAQGGSSRSRSTDMSNNSLSRNGGFCGALQRAPPTMPAGLARRLANKENYGIGRVKVMLRVSDSYNDEETPHFMTVDKKKRQVTLTDPTTSTTVASTSTQERAPMVSAPKMFAFDGLFTAEDQQHDVCASALSEVIPAVLEGSDGCLLSIGYPNSGQSRTMLGTVSTSSELGAIPCAISWLYKGINERRQKSGARFSVRVSALGVSATKPDSSSKDLLAAHATDSDDSPGVYLRDDFLGGPTELRAPTAERAALFLDAALAGRPQSGLEPAMIFTLHVYQYSLSGKGGVAGGRSRLHLIDLGGCANRNGGLPLSGIGNILLAILSGQRHPPNKDHPLTPLLKDCLAPLTCHVTILAHVSHIQSHADALTTIQLASRIHRMRRRKHRFPISSDKALGANNAGHQSGGSSEGPDPSSSDLSADTVIYMGPCDDATDGEHPPVYLPSLSSGDNRCAMNKVLKGTGAEKPSKIPAKKSSNKPQSPVITHRTDSLKRSNVPSSSPTPPSSDMPTQPYSPIHGSPKIISANSSPKIVAGTLRHGGTSKGSNITPKGSPLRRTNIPNAEPPPLRQISEEQWIDGPRVSRSKVAEARHLLREINHVKQCETWIDGPKSTPTKSLTIGNLPGTGTTGGYGFMDSHKKIMIRQWVENQSSHVFQSKSNTSGHQNQQHQQLQQQLRTMTYHLTQFKQRSDDDQHSVGSNMEMLNALGLTGAQSVILNDETTVENLIRSDLKAHKEETDVRSEKSLALSANVQSCPEVQNTQDEEDQDSGPSEVPPALPLIEPLGSREISHESLHRIISRHVSRESLSTNQQNIQTIDCGLQVTEEEIARTMGCEHPLAALSHGNISVVSSFNIGDAFSDCAMGERTRNQFDQLARLREIFTSQLAMAEVTPVFRVGDVGSVYSEPAFRFNTGPGSVCSEPAYRPPSPRCRGCRQSMNASRHSSQTSLPSLNGIMTIAGMEQYASLRHPDGASDPNLQKNEKSVTEEDEEINEKSELLAKGFQCDGNVGNAGDGDTDEKPSSTIVCQSQLPLLPLTTTETAYDSGHDSSTPRTSKHSGISRRAESGYHSVATVRDSDESSFTSAISKEHNRITMKKKRQDKSLCNWLRNPFTCTYPETEGEISDF